MPQPSRDWMCAIRPCLAVAAGMALLAAPAARARAPVEPLPTGTPAPVRVRLADGSVLKVVVREERLALRTAYGVLSVPLRDVRRIDFAARVPEDVARHIAALGSVDYPAREAAEAALARLCAHDPRVAERFELYVCGVELANAFGELTDPAEQRRRFLEEMAVKRRVYGEAYPLDEDFLAALAEMPEASGAALGFDRLVMLAGGAERIEDVQWTPVFDPERDGR